MNAFQTTGPWRSVHEWSCNRQYMPMFGSWVRPSSLMGILLTWKGVADEEFKVSEKLEVKPLIFILRRPYFPNAGKVSWSRPTKGLKARRMRILSAFGIEVWPEILVESHEGFLAAVKSDICIVFQLSCSCLSLDIKGESAMPVVQVRNIHGHPNVQIYLFKSHGDRRIRDVAKRVKQGVYIFFGVVEHSAELLMGDY